MNLQFQVIFPMMWQDITLLPTWPGVPRVLSHSLGALLSLSLCVTIGKRIGEHTSKYHYDYLWAMGLEEGRKIPLNKMKDRLWSQITWI